MNVTIVPIEEVAEEVTRKFTGEGQYVAFWSSSGTTLEDVERLFMGRIVETVGATALIAGCVNGLAVKEDDCTITRSVRAALYSTSLMPTEDDVIGLVVSIREDLVDPIGDRLATLRDELNAAVLEFDSYKGKAE